MAKKKDEPKIKIVVNPKNNVIFEDKGKHSTVKIICDRKQPFYQRKST